MSEDAVRIFSNLSQDHQEMVMDLVRSLTDPLISPSLRVGEVPCIQEHGACQQPIGNHSE